MALSHRFAVSRGLSSLRMIYGAASPQLSRCFASVSMADIKKLRAESGAPIADCKKALQESDCDMDGAFDWLRKKGVAAAAKKADRTAAQGLVAVSLTQDRTRAAIVEVNSETDFVAKNADFQTLVNSIADSALTFDSATTQFDTDTFKQHPLASSDSSDSVGESVLALVSSIRENIGFRRGAALSGHVVGSYVHQAAVAGRSGTKAAVVALKSTNGPVDSEDAAALADRIAMHAVASSPAYCHVSDVPQSVIDAESALLREKAESEGRPAKVIDNIVRGQLNKFFEERVLANQKFIMDDKLSVAKVLKQDGNGLELDSFLLFNVGDGIEVAENDFANEVAEAVAKS